MTTHHSAIALDVLEAGALAGHTTYLEQEGVALSPGAVLQRVADQRRQGRTYWPPCDNITPDGRCAGHERGRTE